MLFLSEAVSVYTRHILNTPVWILVPGEHQFSFMYTCRLLNSPFGGFDVGQLLEEFRCRFSLGSF